MKRALELSLAITLALGTSHALAVGLGQIQVKSRLNQPLVAEIPVTVDRGSEADSLAIGLASAEEFSRVGIERSQIGVPLEFTLVKGASGQAVVRITSVEPVNAPFLDFLVAANWSNGRVLREYTVLLDPPTTAPAVAAVVEATQTETRIDVAPTEPTSTEDFAEAPAPVATAAEPAATPTPDMRSPDVVAEPSVPTTIAAPPPETTQTSEASDTSSSAMASSDGSNYGPVAEGDTLWDIANATKSDSGVSANQLMMAMLEANPQAFSQGNINRLKRGAILRIPSPEEIRAVGSMREAAAKVRSQTQQWRSDVAAPTLVAGSRATPADTADFSSTTAGAVGDDRLALVPPEMGKDGLASTGQAGSAGGTARGIATSAQLTRATEELETRTLEAGELRSRVQDLENIQSSNERLIGLKDSEIADLQRKLAEAQAATAASAAEITPAVAASGQIDPPAATDVVAPAVVSDAAVAPPLDSADAAATPAADGTTPSDDIWGNTGASPEAENPAESDVAAPVAEISPDSTTDTSALATTELGAAPVDTTVPASTPPVVEPVDASAADAQPLPVEADQPWYLNPIILGAAALLALLLGVFAVRGRRKTAAPVQENRPSLADKFADTAVATSAVAAPAGVSESMMDEERQLAEQIAENPSDLGARLELISIYYADNRVDEFRAAAMSMEPYVDDPNEAEWVQVRAMAEDLFPNDPMFAPVAAVVAPVVIAKASDDQSSALTSNDDDAVRWSDDADDDDLIAGDVDDSLVQPPLVAASDNELGYAPTAIVEPVRGDELVVDSDDDNFAFDHPVAELSDDLDALDQKAAGGLDFTLEDAPELDDFHAGSTPVTPLASREPPVVRTLTEASDEVQPPSDSFEFDLPPLDFDSNFANANKPVAPAAINEDDIDVTPAVPVSNSLDADDGYDGLDDEFLVGEDALGTKLDLARAYADMGDPDGARGMLEEVIAEGDADQKARARVLLAELG